MRDRLTPSAKAQLVGEIRAAIKEDFPDLRVERSCLYSSLYTMMFLGRRGIESALQAGTMSWRCVLPDQDDGAMPTHFSYVWSPHELASIISMAQGDLPEMHVWVAIPKTQELIDINTGQFPVFMKQNHLDIKWLAPPPPDFLWASVDELDPNTCFYEPNENAVRLAASAFRHVIKNNKAILCKRFPR